MINETGISVSELNLMISEAIRRDPRTRSVLVRGEVSSFRNQIASGHWYFSLKDAQAVITCAMFRSANLKAKIRPKDGDQVLAEGYIDFYAPQGKVQLIVTGLRPAGLGDMYVRLEELKRKLAAEGLFDPGRKRQIPMRPRKVAVVTSRSGAALHDILNVSGYDTVRPGRGRESLYAEQCRRNCFSGTPGTVCTGESVPLRPDPGLHG